MNRSQTMQDGLPLVGLDNFDKSAHGLPRKVLISNAKSLPKRVWLRIWMGSLIFFIIISPIGLSFGIILGAHSGGFNSGCGQPNELSLVAPDKTFGTLTINQARLIDLAWNLIMGRCIPFSMAIVFYKVATGALMRIAERAPVTYNVFATVTLDLHALTSLIPIAKSAVRTTGWRAKATLWFLLYAACLVLATPSIMDLMTGYVRNQQGSLRAANGTISDTCFKPLATSRSKTDPRDGKMKYFCEEQFWDQICIDDDGYQWGFTLIWLWIFNGLLIFWTVGMYGIWVDTSRNSILSQRGRHLGRWRAIVDLGKAIERDLGANLDGYSNQELEKELRLCPRIKYQMHFDGGAVDKIALSSASTFSKDTSAEGLDCISEY